MMPNPECFGRFALRTQRPFRYANYQCVFCFSNFPCACVSGVRIPVDSILYSVRTLFGPYNRKQVLSYVRDHYHVANTTALESVAAALSRIKEFFTIQQPYGKPPVIAPRRDTGLIKRATVARMLVAIPYRTSLCLPFINNANAAATLHPFFDKVIAFDNHPYGIAEGLKIGNHGTMQVPNLTFYPVLFSQVHEQPYSVVFIDVRRCFASAFLAAINDRSKELLERPPIFKSLPELLLDVDHHANGRIIPLDKVIRYYVRCEVPTMWLWIPYDYYSTEKLVQEVQACLAPEYFIREGMVGASPPSKWLLLTKERR